MKRVFKFDPQSPPARYHDYSDNNIMALAKIEAREKAENNPSYLNLARKFGVMIKVYESEINFGSYHLIYHREGMSLQSFTKRKWYFRYLTAIAQVKVPRKAVELFTYNYLDVDEKEIRKKHLKDRLTAAKASITKIMLAMGNAKASWIQLFPIEDSEDWQKVVQKLKEKQIIVRDLESEIKKLS